MTQEKLKTFEEYKQEHDEIVNQINSLYEKQMNVLELMQKVCPHEHVYRINDPSPYPMIYEEDDEEEKFKCKDCGFILKLEKN